VAVVRLSILWFAAVQQIITETTLIISQAKQQHQICDDSNLHAQPSKRKIYTDYACGYFVIPVTSPQTLNYQISFQLNVVRNM
jgi:hypothetical protein